MKVNKCCKCDGNVCVCSDDITGIEKWSAHCQDCDNGYPMRYEYATKLHAVTIWNRCNPVCECLPFQSCDKCKQ